MNEQQRNLALVVLGGFALYLFSRANAKPLFDFVPADEPLYGTPDHLFPFDYSSPTNLLPVVYDSPGGNP